MAALIANYHEPREQIRGLANPTCTLRAAFLEGGENVGKSYLLACLKPELTPPARMVIVELGKRRGVPTPIELLTEIGDALGWEHFPALDAAKRDIESRRPNVATVSNVTINGSYNNVQAISQDSEDDRLLLAMRATRGFLDDLRTLSSDLRPLILAFDGYEAATSLIDRWFDRSLVPRLCEIGHLRLIVSGREVPHTTVKGRTAPARAIELMLNGVVDEHEWLPIIAALKRRLPGSVVTEQVSFLRGVITALKGTPGGIMPVILGLDPEP